MTRKLKDFGYTLVQHSAYGYKQDVQFKQGVESRALTSEEQVNRVKKVGGIVLTGYSEAEARAQAEMYPPDVETFLTPKAQGTFSHVEVDGLAVYIPKGQK